MGTLPALCWNKKDILPPHMPDHRIMPPYRLNIPPLILPSPQYVLRRCDTLRRAHADSGSPLLHHRAVPEILLRCWSGTVRMPPQNLLSQVRSDMPDVQTCQCSAMHRHTILNILSCYYFLCQISVAFCSGRFTVIHIYRNTI